jgi:hypothetical protein
LEKLARAGTATTKLLFLVLNCSLKRKLLEWDKGISVGLHPFVIPCVDAMLPKKINYTNKIPTQEFGCCCIDFVISGLKVA